MTDFLQLVERVGYSNAVIFLAREEHRLNGLAFMCVPDASRKPHQVLPQRYPAALPDPKAVQSFLERMLAIEEDHLRNPKFEVEMICGTREEVREEQQLLRDLFNLRG